jgi:hypothetical protein
MIYLIVKGNKKQVKQEADKRAIPFVFVRETNKHRGTETIGTASEEYAKAVGVWFAEPGLPPFAPGTLLHYSYSNDKSDTD